KGHRSERHRHLRRRHPLHRPLPAGHHPSRPPPLPRHRADPPLSRAVGTRGRLPGPAAHPPERPGAPLTRPTRPAAGDLGAADPLPGTAPGHGHRRRDNPRHRPRPGQLHHRPENPPPTSLTGRIGQAVLDSLLPPRRPRVSVRKVKSPLSRWNKADPHRPRRSTPVTALTITVSHPETTTQSATHQDQCLTATPGP